MKQNIEDIPEEDLELFFIDAIAIMTNNESNPEQLIKELLRKFIKNREQNDF